MAPGLLGGFFGRDRQGKGLQDSEERSGSHDPGPVDVREVSLRCAEAREEERRRMAVDLHDGPIQLLVNLVLRLDMAEKNIPAGADASRAELVEIRQFARNILQDMRRFMFELRPASLDEFALLPVLRQYVYDFRTQYQIPIEVHLQDTNWTLGRDIEINLFRILQEALTNVRKHAHASRVDLTLRQEEGAVVAEVIDDGRGFDVKGARQRAQQEKKLGLASMEDRARALGGALSVESFSGGTHVRIVIPVGEEAANI